MVAPSTARIRSPGRMPASRPGRRRSRSAPRTRAAQGEHRRRCPRRRRAACGRARPAAGGDVARIGVEMVEQLVEEAADQRLGAGAPDRVGGVPGRPASIGAAASPQARDRSSAAARWASRMRPGASRRRLPSRSSAVQRRVQRGQAAQAPHGQLRDRHRLQRARRHEGEGGADHIGHQRCSNAGAARRTARRPPARRPSSRSSSATRAAGQAQRHLASRAQAAPRAGSRPPPRSAARLGAARRAGAGARMMWNTSPPVTGLASASRTSTSCARRKLEAVRRPVRRLAASSCIQKSSGREDTGTSPLAPLSGDCDEKAEPCHPGDARGERSRPPCRP